MSLLVKGGSLYWQQKNAIFLLFACACHDISQFIKRLEEKMTIFHWIPCKFPRHCGTKSDLLFKNKTKNHTKNIVDECLCTAKRIRDRSRDRFVVSSIEPKFDNDSLLIYVMQTWNCFCYIYITGRTISGSQLAQNT